MGIRRAAIVVPLLIVGALGAQRSGLVGTQPDRDATGAVAESTDKADVFALRVGDCLPATTPGDNVVTTGIVRCEEPHRAEVYASLTATGGAEYPGEAAMTSQAGKCTVPFATFVGRDYTASDLGLFYFYPTAMSWTKGDREILCIVEDPAGQVTGTLRGANR